MDRALLPWAREADKLDIPFSLSIETMPYILGAVLLAVVLVIVYFYRIKPVVQFPLSKEEDLGYGRIHLPQLGRFNEGRITTARNHFIENFSTALTKSPADKQDAVLQFRNRIFDKDWLLAQRCGRDKVIYLFDANPLDPKYCHREDKGTETPIRQIGPVRDCGSVGSFRGFEYVFVKLDKDTAQFTAEQRELNQTLAEGMKYIEDAASNLERVKFLKDRVEMMEDQLEQEQRRVAAKSAELDTCKSALGQQQLSEPGQVKIGVGFGPKAKALFGDFKQYVAAAIGYLVIAPVLIGNFAPETSPPATTYLTAGIVVVCFFALPALRMIVDQFGRWRH